MTQNELCNFFINRSATIANAISTGAGWEIWAQVDFILAVRANLPGYSGAREVPYPWSKKKLDVLVGSNESRYAIEMKVESAASSAPFNIKLLQDVAKIQAYVTDDGLPLARWVVGIGYSVPAKNDMQLYANNNPATTVYQDAGQNNIGVIVITAS